MRATILPIIPTKAYTVYSGYNGHVYSGHSDIVATFPGTKYIYSIIFRSDIVANQIYRKTSNLSRTLI